MSHGSLSLISPYVMVFTKSGRLIAGRPGACASARDSFLPLRILFSQLKMSAVCLTKQPSNFGIAAGATEVVCQPVTQSVGNVCFMLPAERGEFFAEAVEQHGG